MSQVKGALSDKAEADPGDDWTSADVDPLAELARIRKSVKAHVVVTNEFCDQPGVTANSVLQCADGFQVKRSPNVCKVESVRVECSVAARVRKHGGARTRSTDRGREGRNRSSIPSTIPGTRPVRSNFTRGNRKSWVL